MIDWSHVQRLCDEVGAEDFEEVLELFFDEVSTVITKLENLVDRSEMAQDMHFLKGGALSLGFHELSQLCHNAEQAAGNGESDSIDIAAIIGCYAVSKQMFLDNYQQKLAA